MALQEELRHRVAAGPPGAAASLGGRGGCYLRPGGEAIFGAAALYRYPELSAGGRGRGGGGVSVSLPLGAFELPGGPHLRAALAQLHERPDVVLVDGQGIAHPRGLGLAAHLGLVMEIPTIGVAKSRLVGEGVEPDLAAGSFKALIWKGKQVGLILRTQKGIKPLYVPPDTASPCRNVWRSLWVALPATGFPCRCGRRIALAAACEPRPWGRDSGATPRRRSPRRAARGTTGRRYIQSYCTVAAGNPTPTTDNSRKPPDLLVEADSSHIPEIDHFPLSP